MSTYVAPCLHMSRHVYICLQMSRQKKNWGVLFLRLAEQSPAVSDGRREDFLLAFHSVSAELADL